MFAVFRMLAKEFLFVHHVKPSGDFLEALTWPARELVVCTLNESTDQSESQEKVSKLLDQLEEDVPRSEIAMGGWGPVIGDERKFIDGKLRRLVLLLTTEYLPYLILPTALSRCDL